MTFLIDTNVISETRRRQPDTRLLAWFRHVDPAALRISVLTLGEIAKGAMALARRDPVAGQVLASWLAGLRGQFNDRLIPVDAEIADRWGRLAAARPLPVIAGLLAATALVHGLTLVTRHISDVADTGAVLLDPWTD